MMDAAVSMMRVVRRFGPNVAIQDLDFTVAKEELCGIVGSHGAGRTTLLRLIAAILRPDQGSIHVFGVDTVPDPRNVQDIIGYVPQKAGIYDDLTVRENIRLHADLRGVGSELSTPGLAALSGYFDAKAAALSHSQRRWLALTCAVVGKPRLLLVDEPTHGLDAESRQRIGRLLRGFVRQGLTVIWNTSYMDEAEQCDRVLVLNGGRAVSQDTPCALISRLSGRTALIEVPPGDRHRAAARLRQTAGIMDVDVHRDRLTVLTDTASRTLSVSAASGLAGRPTVPRLDDAIFAILAEHDTSRPRPLTPPPGPALPGTAPPLAARGLTLRSRRGVLVDNADVSVADGEIVGLAGPHDTGKGAMLRLLCGLAPPTGGIVRVSGHDLRSDRRAAIAHLSYASTAAPAYPDLAVRHQLEFAASAHGMSGPERSRRVARILAEVGLAPAVDRRAGELSASLQWRLLLATLLIHRPRLLLLDDLSSPLDAVVRRLFWSDLSAVAAGGIGVLVASHVPDDAERCDRILRLQDGHVLANDHGNRFA